MLETAPEGHVPWMLSSWASGQSVRGTTRQQAAAMRPNRASMPRPAR